MGLFRDFAARKFATHKTAAQTTTKNNEKIKLHHNTFSEQNKKYNIKRNDEKQMKRNLKSFSERRERINGNHQKRINKNDAKEFKLTIFN